MRFVLILIVAAWGLAAVWAFLRTSERSLDAQLTAGYILAWPALVVTLALFDPVPLWLSVPAAFGLIPWILAPMHLTEVLRHPSASRPDELVGIPRAYWAWGGVSAVLLGIVFNRYA